jgi:hypothetical protein
MTDLNKAQQQAIAKFEAQIQSLQQIAENLKTLNPSWGMLEKLMKAPTNWPK